MVRAIARRNKAAKKRDKSIEGVEGAEEDIDSGKARAERSAVEAGTFVGLV